MIPKPIEQVTNNDIIDLVTNRIPESKTLEYKEQLPGNSDGDKKECTADITAFANTQGGDLLYGITEERDIENNPIGVPKEATGLSTINPENEILRLTTLIRDTTDARLTGLQPKTILGFPGPVIVIRVPNSWNKPHMVKATGRFFARSNSAKYPMDATEVRNAFLQTANVTDRIKQFHTERASAIARNETPAPIPTGAKLLLTLTPLQAMTPGNEVDIKGLQNRVIDLQPINAGGTDLRYNLDGFLTYTASSQDKPRLGYIQIYRNGTIELVDTTLLNSTIADRSIPSTALEHALLTKTSELWRVQESVGIQPPVIVSITLTGVQDYHLAVDQRLYRSGWSGRPIDRDTIGLPPVLIEESSGANLGVVLRPAFDALWQAAGWNECKHYDAQGNWTGSVLP
jgi:hypothetical protein